MTPSNLTIKSTREALNRGDFSPEELIRHYENKIEKENKKLNALLTPFKPVDEQLKLPEGLLRGIPYALKDNILFENSLATAGSKILENYRASFDATVVKKLKTAGAVCLGKTNLDEFAMGTSTENSAFGPTKNPHDISRVPGGSSGGSAAAVAADLCVFALGSDTGGSIRQPAALCGVVGLKPTYGRVSRHGLIAMASSLDQIGPITKNVYDAALVMNVIAGHDEFDATTAKKNVPDYTKSLEKEIKGLKVGIPKEFFRDGLSVEVAERIKSTISILESIGCNIAEVSIPNFEYALAAYYVIVPSEVSANLSRFDGIRYGYSSKSADTLIDTYFESRTEGFGPESKRRIMIGAYALSSGYYDAYYLKAQKVRRLIKNDFDSAFEKVDVIVGPVSPTTAFRIGEKSSDPLALYLEDIYTVPVNLAGLPGISIPCGNGENSGLPVGFQLIGKAFDEETLLRTAYQLEQNLK
ncbi:MAG: aspartyl/glutamyl-tRNA amidotransferase subunit A [Candidatus Yanofskybacteria bacterium RIFCSPHIGHO2_01_FULL_43_42]|uniref:Glutamyl-tRNA(Gln) amidotransferase subunit A n=1 Tax=Candidatus Yanofskybacteria bacterium RIFCSPLOWO2_01_FULL_43_22 TaxID=1802695 RepID=A0A1F8GGT9_9BACT|nr:MAG: aspartyl/glutamyl-tRNA amidotransferase subunit A [Candidatus Yanofskybacteria bacterium RIFCSPHIGHO2_01_FULL_43_42]OGN13003.1 MAG: aspartyl/glutamyl-tRNA amidotransferase subunit A [Candidatus Yanofskybacteria bacterium RIFCSPHIGHO2_02_FULL_43_17]OGN23916.1 MAG: aspartyl/glutamyl-tRNA amidotransferase subunit A [Candidatus Yanofskybacteria bacterium RIFCSPLOWO2_01_FULL_43_22]